MNADFWFWLAVFGLDLAGHGCIIWVLIQFARKS